ncbi:DEAD-box ATP-dependent RNA helicase 41 [Typha latifolia]|uniref:DEAD-box ATP-dependent RNA helicase 41 n=1 Tax=Typha latifolia TaxID=4733 RepID=UPI003C2AFD29
MESNENNLTDSSAAESSVKERSCEQREALPGEPRCVICGRYGEYICDKTDDDICSMECKNILLSRHADTTMPALRPPRRVNIPMSDECFYVRDDNITISQGLNRAQIESLRSKIDICVKGQFVPDPVLSFTSCDLPQKLEQNLETAGYIIPTPVQMQSIPAALLNKNLLVSADTGSGKTASFLVPIVSHCTRIRSKCLAEEKKPLAMVLAPTRELCVQVEEQAKVLGKGLPFKTALVVGGEALAGQIYRIQNGVELIVGTPGRLIDLLSKYDVELSEVSLLVLDEVDCMLQKEFQDQVMQIFRALSHPQVLMFSATISQEVEKMANTIAKDLIYIYSGKPSRSSKSVKQIAIWVESKQKKKKLFEILMSKQHYKPPVVVFVGSRVGADLLSEAINVATGLRALSIHGEKTMKDRRDILRMFLMGEIPVIVSTGVLGRGIDLLKVCQVIIFDMPNSMDEYVHQVGRASRMGQEGTAIVFVNEGDKKLFRELVQNLKSAGAVVPRELANSKYLASTYTVNNRNKRKYGL